MTSQPRRFLEDFLLNKLRDLHDHPYRKGTFLDIVVLEREDHPRFSPQLLLLLLLTPFARCTSVVDTIPTYEHPDQSTGKTLLCTQCPPGTYMAAHCTPSTPTQCVPCGENQFTELWNYLPRCLFCSNVCYEDQEVEKECSATSNRVCRCKGGFYWSSGFCFRHSECEPGQGVKTKGITFCLQTRSHLNSTYPMLQTRIALTKMFLQERQIRTRCVRIVAMVISPIRHLRRNLA